MRAHRTSREPDMVQVARMAEGDQNEHFVVIGSDHFWQSMKIEESPTELVTHFFKAFWISVTQKIACKRKHEKL